MYVDDGDRAHVSPSQSYSLVDSFSLFKDRAWSGQFEITEQGGKALLQAIDHLQKSLEDQNDNLGFIAQRPPLGRLEGGTKMASFVQEVAVDGNGLVTRVRQLRESLDLAKEGIRKSMEMYQQNEHKQTSSANNIANNGLYGEAK